MDFRHSVYPTRCIVCGSDEARSRAAKAEKQFVAKRAAEGKSPDAPKSFGEIVSQFIAEVGLGGVIVGIVILFIFLNILRACF